MTTVVSQQADEILPEFVTSPPKEEVHDEETQGQTHTIDQIHTAGQMHVVEEIQTQNKEQHWLTKETHLLPKNNIWIVLPGLFLVTGLAALDQTIVSTANPTIAASLHGGPTSISWVGSGYLLASTAVIPLCGRLSDLIGRKPVLWFAISLFLFGSTMCGVAKNLTWLNICRGLQGLGAGGTENMVNILLSDIFPLEKRGFYGGLFDLVWAFSGLIGPLIGGALSQSGSSWRWCFFINLPIGGLAFLILAFNLKLNPSQRRPLEEVWKTFDKGGYMILLTGIILFLLGLTFAESHGFSNLKAILCIAIGGSLFFVFALYECAMEKYFPEKVQTIFPSRLFRNRTTLLMFFGIICRAPVFMATVFYLPVYYQTITGASPVMSGVKMLSLTLSCSLSALISGYNISRIRRCHPTIIISFVIMTIGTGLLTMLHANTPAILQAVYPIIFGIGFGIISQSAVMVIQAAMPVKEMAVSGSAVYLVRFASFTVGVAIAGSIFNSGVRSNTSKIQGYNRAGLPADQSNLRNLIHLQPPELAIQVVKAYSDAIRAIWIVFTPIVGVGFLAVLGIREYSMTRNIVQQE